MANEIGVRSWTHHYRDFNKMADKAVNLAMDTKRSIQVGIYSGRPEFDLLGQFVRNDVCQYLSRTA
jgi:hypothetical protein